MASSMRHRRWLWHGCLSAGFLFSLIAAAAAQDDGASPGKKPPGRSVEARIEHGLLTLHADGAPLAEVLRAIGQAGGFEVVLRGGFATPVRASFADRPLEHAVRRLVAGHSVVIVYEASDPESGAAALARIAVIENQRAASAGSAQLPVPVAAEPQPDDADDDPMRRAPAPPKAGSPGPREVIETASHAFAYDGATGRSRAVAALTRLDGPDARRLLRERALVDDHVGLRMQALNALARSEGERAINVLAQALRQDPEPRVRLGAVRALGRLGGERARRILEHAATDLDPATGAAAERALAAWPAQD